MKTIELIKYYQLLSCKCDDDDPRVYGINNINMYKKYINILIHVIRCIYVFAQGIHIYYMFLFSR